ncbi:MAG: TetR/AcrR family transcriptional regulator [Woeseiaceae bacterium]|nr:TetR/AcrR family transcriptional regulator [Woeseiaceae bacterium]
MSGMNRSEHRIPKLRSRGRANRRRLLDEAERLIAASNGDSIRFSDVFESAGVSRGSAYRIYIGMDDLMQDLASEWISNFVDYLADMRPDTPPDTWQALSDRIMERGAEYWDRTSNTLRVMPRVRSNLPASYRQSLIELSHCLAEHFERYFVMPEVENWTGKLNFYVQVADLTFSDSVRVSNRVTRERLLQAQELGRTYLAFHLPESVPIRRL